MISRRQFVHATSAALALSPGLLRGENEKPAPPRGKAEHCILLWLGGGAGQIDTWDPKAKGDSKAKKAGSYYDAIDSAIPGTQVCEHLTQTATVLDRFNLIRTVHHDVIDEHAAAVNRMHTGRPISGTVVYPSLGSIIAHQRGAAGDNVPAYVLIGYPSTTRGPGFLGAKHGYIYLTDTTSSPPGLTRPKEISADRQKRRDDLLNAVRKGYVEKHAGETLIENYDAAIAQALELAGPKFTSLFQLEREPGALRDSYGGEFGQRCLLARRLVEAGSRFVEVSHNLNFLNGTGWDVHNEGILKQHALIRELDTALATLVRDLEKKKLLQKTLIVVATEFGRPAGFDGGGGRGHWGKAFSVALAGGGLRNGQTIGETNETAQEIVARAVSVPDLFATILATLDIDPGIELYAGERPVPATDRGTPIGELFS
jgi:hypothetical protein